MEFYRYELVQYADHDEYYEYCVPSHPNPSLQLRTYDLIKETEKGYWIGYNGLSYKKWIPKESKKRFAYPTTEEALTNFIKRTERRIRIINWTFSSCKIGLELAKNILNHKEIV